MQDPIMLSPSDIVTIFLGICGAIAIIGEAAKWLATAIKSIQKPEEKQNAAIEKLAEIIEGMRVLQRVNLATLSHAIHGNDIEKLKEEEHELQEYLTRKEK